MDMSSVCGACGNKTQDYPIYCYMCDDYYCSENCHLKKHARPWQKFQRSRLILLEVYLAYVLEKYRFEFDIFEDSNPID